MGSDLGLTPHKLSSTVERRLSRRFSSFKFSGPFLATCSDGSSLCRLLHSRRPVERQLDGPRAVAGDWIGLFRNGQRVRTSCGLPVHEAPAADNRAPYQGALMRVLLSTIGSRGDVQPLVALAVAVEGARPGGPAVRAARLPRLDRRPGDARHADRTRGARGPGKPAASAGSTHARAAASDDGRHGRRAIRDDRGGRSRLRRHRGRNGLQIAAPSVAEKMGIPYVFAAYCPTVLPSPHHAPPVLRHAGRHAGARHRPTTASSGPRMHERWNDTWGPAAQLPSGSRSAWPRSADVRSHIFTDRPWLAADPTLAPWPDPADQAVFQTGAWILPDRTSAVPGAGGVPRRRRAARLLRLRQHPRARKTSAR